MTDEEHRKRRAEYRRRYLTDPEHPERREKKNAISRQSHKRRKVAGKLREDNSLPDRSTQQSDDNLAVLNQLMHGRRYDR
jgi:hypothetical protein